MGIRLSIPNNPLLAGTTLFFQALELDPGAPQGVSMSSGLAMTIGS